MTVTTKKDCHVDPSEIYPNFWVGSAWIDLKLYNKCSVIVSLNKTEGDIWDTGWRGTLVYLPITDYCALPIDVLTSYVVKITTYLNMGSVVGMHCIGGHGRTGYVAAAVLWHLGVIQKEGYADPVKYVREKYCKNAIESVSQLESLEEFTGLVGLVEKYFTPKYSSKVIQSWGKGTWNSKDSAKSGNYSYGGYENGGLYGSDIYDPYYDDPYYKDVKDPVDDKGVSNSTGSSIGKLTSKPSAYYDPCYECIHSELISAALVVTCELGYETGELCERFFAWVDTNYNEGSDETFEGEVVSEEEKVDVSKEK